MNITDCGSPQHVVTASPSPFFCKVPVLRACDFVRGPSGRDAAKVTVPAVKSTIRRLECKNLSTDVLSRCGLINLFQLHSKLLHLADKSRRLCVTVSG